MVERNYFTNIINNHGQCVPRFYVILVYSFENLVILSQNQSV